MGREFENIESNQLRLADIQGVGTDFWFARLISSDEIGVISKSLSTWTFDLFSNILISDGRLLSSLVLMIHPDFQLFSTFWNNSRKNYIKELIIYFVTSLIF